MLKKISLLLLITSAFSTHADQLADAIRASNLQKVTVLLSASTVTTEQLAKYFDTAEQVIRTRRNKIDAGTRSSDDYRISNRTGVAGCITMACLAIMLASAARDPLSKSYLKFFFVSLSGFMISTIATAICSGLDEEVYRKRLQNLYGDAIRIKELLYDYELNLSNSNNL